MANEFLGEVKPLYGRWHWPYTFMQPGDWFIVDQALRNGEAVRHHATVRAAQLGIILSTTVNDPEHPGFTRVTRRSHSDQGTPDGEVVDYGTAATKLADWYGFNIDELPFGRIEAGVAVKIDAVQRKPPSVRRLLVEFLEKKLGLVFERDGFTVEQLAKSATMESWKSEGPSLDDVMG